MKSLAKPEDKCIVDDYDVNNKEQEAAVYEKKLQESIAYIGSPKL
jgi:hypothetical protein